MNLVYLDEQLFTWFRWRKTDFTKIICREELLVFNRNYLNKIIVGYCDAEKLICRPKLNCKAIMCFDKYHFWFHLTNKEFNNIF
jgi:hypothetical protein